MRRHLIIGLSILLVTNAVVLAGVSYNRMGQPLSQLTLTERELTLPFGNRSDGENSGTSVNIRWRAASNIGNSYYGSSVVEMTQDALFELGFMQLHDEHKTWDDSRELFWALEFDGKMHKAEVDRAKVHYQSVLAILAQEDNETNRRLKNESFQILEREKTSNSRLFFIEASTRYELLASKYSDQKNVIVVKGLARPRYNSSTNRYSLVLENLSIANIMIPLQFSGVLEGLNGFNRREIEPPRYSFDVNWGNRLEPWVVNSNRLIK